jgi:hypothetical protein
MSLPTPITNAFTSGQPGATTIVESPPSSSKHR